MRIINIKYKFIAFVFIAVIAITTACEDDPTVTRSKNLNIYGPATVYIGDVNTYEAPLYTLNDKRTWSWGISGDGASNTSGEGEFFEVAFNKPGTYSVALSESDRTGSIEVEAISKVLSLSGDTTSVEESYEDSEIAIPLTVDNTVAEEIAISYTIGGTAIEGIDYELISSNPLILNADSEEEDYAVYVKLIADTSPETSEKFITVTLNSVITDLQDEVVLSDEEDLLVAGIKIEDDSKIVSIKNIAPEEIVNPGVVSFEVLLSAESSEDVEVNYSISGIGITDATPDGGGTITFASGETSKFIYLQFNNAAFSSTQSVIVTVNSISTNDDETTLDEERNTKTFEIH